MNKSESKKQIACLPNIADIIYLTILWLILYLKPNMLFADGSTGWHIFTGNFILQKQTVPHLDILSYSMLSKAWVAYEWLSDLMMAVLVKLGGLNLLNIIFACSISWLMALIYKNCRERGCNLILAVLLTLMGSAIAATHWLIRPHIFTFFAIYIFTVYLNKYYRDLISPKKLIITLLLTTLVWVNTHPSFILGFAIVAIYAFSLLIQYFASQAQNIGSYLNKAKILFICMILMSLISLFNPYGLELHSYIANYLLNTHTILSFTDEFLSPVFHGDLQPLLLELLFALTFIGLIVSKQKLTLPEILLYLLFAHLALSAKRNMALYAIVCVPIIAQLFNQTQFDPPSGYLYEKLKSIWQNIIETFKNFDQEFYAMEKQNSLHLLPILVSLILIAICFNGGKCFSHPILQSGFNLNSQPDTNLAIIKKLALDPKHGFSIDNWGGILRYEIDYPVFIDDRADFYGEDFYMEYGQIIQAHPGWENLLIKHQINWLLLPKTGLLSQALLLDKNWQLLAEDKSSQLFIRDKNSKK